MISLTSLEKSLSDKIFVRDAVKIHRNSVANKLNGESAFSIEQAMLIQETYFPDLEIKYLFSRDSGKESDREWI